MSAFAYDQAYRRFFVEAKTSEKRKSALIARAEKQHSDRLARAREKYDRSIAAIQKGEMDAVTEP